MIATVRGTILHKDAESVVVEAQGVGYRLFVSHHTASALPERGQETLLLAHMVVREDAIHLYGFLAETEREAFLSLLGVSGIGPKLARTIMSGIRPEELAKAVVEGKRSRLEAIQGVGKRMAERILVELRGKVAAFHPASAAGPSKGETWEGNDGLEKDVVSALANLGYRKSEALRVLDEARGRVHGSLTLETWVKEALRMLAK